MNALTLQFADSIATLTLDQPDSKVNVLSRAMWSELDAACRNLAERDDVHGLIITSAKPGIFIAGADLNELVDVPDPNHPPIQEFIAFGMQVLDKLERLPFPVAACIDGAALGGGLEVALACDFRLAGTSAKLKLGLPEITLGLIPGWGGTQRLPRLVGPTSAIEMMLNNQQLDAETARYRGLVSKVVPSENLAQEAIHLLRESRANWSWQPLRERKRRPLEIDCSGLSIEEMSEGKASEAKFNAMSLSPEALNALRDAVKEGPQRHAALAAIDVVEKGCRLPLPEALRLETEAFLRLAGSPESRQLIAEFFASRKK